MDKMEKKLYFRNLNSLRFIAALIVLISHVDQFKDLYGVYNLFGKGFSIINGEFGVLLFFVLSGFLITYLLLKEIQITGTIKIKAFYIRRALRIWPLYFLTIILAFFVFPFINFLILKDYSLVVIWSKLSLKLFFYCIFMPNIVLDFLGFIPYASHSWTIGAEEQFYFIWPLLFKKIKNKTHIFLGVIIIYLAVYYLLRYFPGENKYAKAGFLIWIHYPISCMAIGGGYAYIVFIKTNTAEKIKKKLFSLWFQLVMTVVLFILVFKGYYFSHFHNEIYAILLGYQVCNLAANPKPIFNLENKLFNYLGKISYGIYMVHPLAIACAIKFCIILKITSNWILYPSAFIMALVFAAFSWHFYEQYFIKKKIKYSTIITGDNAK